MVRLLTRLIPILQGVVHYRNPAHIVFKRMTAQPDALITIVDRQSGVSVRASADSYHMFGETWYTRDYDVPGCLIRSGDRVLDIGAHQGFFSCYAASRGAEVHAFEPSPGSYARLMANVERNGFRSRVHANQQAVSNTNGTARMRCFDYLGGGSNTIVPSHVPHLTPQATVSVTTVAIDAVLDSIPGRVRLCKLDCEGAELDIVRAISNPAKVDAFALEFHPHAYPLEQLVKTMTGWGTHQVSFARSSYMLYAVSNECLFAHAAAGY